MDFAVDPGLYALGNPDKDASVLVTANYKASFDQLRKSLPGRDLWILVLDTKGINVWCAAGKGTFSTDELVQRIEESGLVRVVSHRQLILPQLSGPGVAAHHVKKLSGFKVVYGPVRSVDLPLFMDSGLQATPEMRHKTFSSYERTVLIPMELVSVLKWALVILPVFFLLGGIGGSEGFWSNALHRGVFAVWAVTGAIIAGSVLTPLLLPWIPGRSFSLKGFEMGLIAWAILLVIWVFGNLKDRHPGYKLDLKIKAQGKPDKIMVGFSALPMTPEITDTWNDINGDAKYREEDGDTYNDLNKNGKFDAYWIAGFDNQRAANGVHDDVWARVMVFDDGETRLAMVSLDAIAGL